MSVVVKSKFVEMIIRITAKRLEKTKQASKFGGNS
jgi:hypothetical protein